MKRAKKPEGQCLMPQCDSPADPARRGLCAVCYRTVRVLIRQGKTTEKSLLQRRLILPSRPGRRSVRADRAREAVVGK